MIEMNNVSVNYGNTKVLNDFSITVNKGEKIALMGPSGSGKTTVLKLIGNQLQPASGKVICHANKIGYMFQEPRLVPWLTAAENVNLVLGDTPETLPQAIKWLESIGLGDAVNKYPSELSGGMQQRTALARTLAYDPDLLLLDEPFSALDEDMAENILSLVKAYTRDKTVILVTHNSNHAKQFADTIYILKNRS